MKRLICMLLLLAMLACVPTPEHEIIENKGDKKDWQVDAQPITEDVLIPIDAETVASWDYEQQESSLYERLNAPKLWNTENSDFGFPIVAKDCPVFLPDVQAVPVFEAEPRSITQEDLDKVISVVFPVDGVSWYQSGVITKEDCANLIRGVQEELDKTEPGSSEYNYQKNRLEEYTECYSALYKVAPSASDIKPIEPVLGTYQQGFSYEKGKDAVANYITGLDVRASVAGEEWELTAYTGDEIYGNSIYAKRDTELWSDDEQPLDAPYGVQMTKAEAMQKAAKIAETLTDSELAPCYCAPMYFHTNEGDDLSRRWSQWRVVLMRAFNGVGTAYAEEDIGSAMESTVTKTVAYEKMTIDLDDHGVTAITWRTPMKVTGIVSSDAQLISFEEAANKAMKHIAARWKYDAENDRENGTPLTVYLRRVTLGLWRIAKKNGGWYYVPVYHFFSEAHEGSWATSEGFWGEGTPRQRFLDNLKRYESGAQGKSFSLSNDCLTFGAEYWGGVTVNALDGTIIDKDKGY